MSLDTTTRDRIDALLKEHRVVLFMKGTRHQPMCGFSASAQTGSAGDGQHSLLAQPGCQGAWLGAGQTGDLLGIA